MEERNIAQSLRRLAIEVLVGFIGVYAAFALSAYKDKRDEIDRRHQIKRALVEEVSSVRDLMGRNHGYATALSQFDSAVKAGKRPIPHAYIEPIGLSMNMWEATKQSNGLSALDVPTFVKVSHFYNEWSDFVAFYNELHALSVNVIMPATARGRDGFYDASGKLRPDIQRLYYYDLRSLDHLVGRTEKNASEVIAVLARDTI